MDSRATPPATLPATPYGSALRLTCVVRSRPASTRVWDLWEYEDVFQSIANAPDARGQSVEAAHSFFERCVTQGAEMFEDTADNMTGMVVYLNPMGTKLLERTAAAKGGKTPGKGGRTPMQEDTVVGAGNFSV